jgi:hypothetical protein
MQRLVRTEQPSHTEGPEGTACFAVTNVFDTLAVFRAPMSALSAAALSTKHCRRQVQMAHMELLFSAWFNKDGWKSLHDARSRLWPWDLAETDARRAQFGSKSVMATAVEMLSFLRGTMYVLSSGTVAESDEDVAFMRFSERVLLPSLLIYFRKPARYSKHAEPVHALTRRLQVECAALIECCRCATGGSPARHAPRTRARARLCVGA